MQAGRRRSTGPLPVRTRRCDVRCVDDAEDLCPAAGRHGGVRGRWRGLAEGGPIGPGDAAAPRQARVAQVGAALLGPLGGHQAL